MSLVDLYKNLIKFFSPQETGRIIQKAVLNILHSFVVHGEKELFIKNKNLILPFKADGLLFVKNKFIVLEVKTGEARESLLQKIVKDKIIYCLIRINTEELNVFCDDEEIKLFLINKLGGD